MDNDLTALEQMDDIDAFVPSNDTFALMQQRIQRDIRAATIHIRPRFVSAITSVVMSGSSYQNAARKYHIAASTLSKYVNQDKYGSALVNALQRLKSLDEGTKYQQREAMLWRIAARNEEKDPRTAITALAEINRTKADTPENEQKQKENDTLTNQPQVIIQLQDSRLLPSPLDQLPNHMKEIN